MVPADSRRISRVPRYSGYHWALTSLHIRGSHPLWPDFPERSVRDPSAVAWSYYPDAALPQRRFGLFPGRSPLLGESLLFSLPRGTKMFQFPRFASSHNMMMTVLQTAGLSHSEIRGSKVICTLPRLIAAYHVLHRLREPRHPPCALVHFLGRRFSSFTMKPQLILSAVSSLYCYNQEELSLFILVSLYSFVCQYVKDLYGLVRMSGVS